MSGPIVYSNRDVTVCNINKHKDYDAMVSRWDRVEDSLQDEEAIKLRGTEYLPMPSGMMSVEDVNIRDAMYSAYVMRSIYYSYPKTTIGALMGLITKKPTKFEVPLKLEPLIEHAGLDNDCLEVVRNRTLEHQLSYGRYGILLDIPEGAEGVNVLPHMVEYTAKNIVNWVSRKILGKEVLIALVLDESYASVGKGFEVTNVAQFRICALANIGTSSQFYYTYVTNEEGVKEFDIDQPQLEEHTVPSLLGKKLTHIPFQIFNALSLEFEPDLPPLMQLVDISFAIYRGEADYRHTLFMQGQATPWATGVDSSKDSIIMGSGTLMEISDPNAKLGFLEISGNGLTGQETALNDLHKRASEQGVGLQEAGSNQSGEALGVRVGIKTASLAGITRMNAKGFETLLQWVAEWMSVPPEEVKVTPNTDFAQGTKSTKDLLDVIAATEKGLMRLEDLYNFEVKHDFTNAVDFEDWKNDLEQNGFSSLGIVEGIGETDNDGQL